MQRMDEPFTSTTISPELLKKLRAKSGLTQKELAERLDVTQETLSKYENGKISIPLDKLMELINQIGADKKLVVAEPNRAFSLPEVEEPYRDYMARLSLLGEFIQLEKPDSDEKALTSPANLEFLVRSLGQLPRVVIAGRSDAGKSHVANCLLGLDLLPTKYQPTTRIPTVLVHTDHRPKHVKDECILMRGEFDLELLCDAQKFSENFLAGGSKDLIAKSTIHAVGDERRISSGGLVDASNEADPQTSDWAVIFLEADILKACVLVDTPGFAASDTDTDRATEACKGAEMLIYCSPFIGCLNQDDFLRLDQLLKRLPSPEKIDSSFPLLGNFLFVVTHAGPQVSDQQLEDILDGRSQHFAQHFSKDLKKRGLIQQEVVAERFVPFWGELESRHRTMRDKIGRMLHEDFPKYRLILADKRISEFRDKATESNKTKIDEWKTFLTRWEESKERVRKLEKDEPRRRTWVEDQRKSIAQAIAKQEKASIAAFKKYYKNRMTVESIEKVIRSRFSKQEDAQNEIAPLLLKEIQEQVASDLESRSGEISDQINSFLKGYSNASKLDVDSDVNGNYAPGFDATASFVSGLAGLTTFGALAFWAASLGNLGGYIIAAKVVGLLTAIGVPTGGVAAVVAAISAAGGPVVFALAIAIIAAITAYFWFSKSWQKGMAEKVFREFEKQTLQEKISDHVQQFWRDTLYGFQQAADQVETDWAAYLLDLKLIVKSDSKKDIEKRIKSLETLNDFFLRLPWVRLRKGNELRA